MNYADGFYKYDDTLFYATSFVRGPNYELNKNNSVNYTYPIHGWYWFNSLDEACSHFNLNPVDYTNDKEENIWRINNGTYSKD